MIDTINASRYVLISITASALASPVAAFAQSSGGDQSLALAPIIITATKQQESLSRVPISVAAFDAKTMDTMGVRSIQDIALQTPGLVFSSNSFSNTETDIAIRGIAAGSGAATTGVYIDDVPVQIRSNLQTSFGSSFPQVFDLERIEVLRGPQGTLFGAGAEGGAVRFITPTPSLTDSSLYARTEVSSTQNGGPSYEAGVAGGAPIIDDVLGFRMSAWYREDGGYVARAPYDASGPNDVRINDANSADTTAFQAKLAYRPAAGLLITPSIYYQREHTNDSGTFWGMLSNPAQDQLTSGNVIAQPWTDHFTLPSLKVTWNFGKLALTSVTAYFDRDASATQDYTELDSSFLTYLLHNNVDPSIPESFTAFLPGQNAPGALTARQENLSQELRLNSTDPNARLHWTVGAFFSRQLQDESFLITDLYSQQIAPLAAIFGEGLTDGQFIFIGYNHSLEKQLSAFGQADLRLIGPLSLTAGARYSKIDFDFERTSAGPLNYLPPGPDYLTHGGSESARPFTPKLGLNLQIDPDDLLYVSAAKGFREGGVNPPLFAGCTNLPVPLSYGPDSTWSYEAGSKNSLLSHRIRMETSVYWINWNDIQEFVSPGGACAGNGFTDNLGRAESRGFDYQISARATDRLTLGASAGFDRAKYLSTVMVNGTVYTDSGDTLGVTPWQLSGNAEYDFPFQDADGYVFIQDSYGSRDSGRVADQDDPRAAGYDPAITADPSINRLDMRLGLRIAGVDASLFVDNALNRTPELGKYHDVNDPADTLYYYHTIRPRTIGLTIVYR